LQDRVRLPEEERVTEEDNAELRADPGSDDDDENADEIVSREEDKSDDETGIMVEEEEEERFATEDNSG
jgi:hypothetical protein